MSSEQSLYLDTITIDRLGTIADKSLAELSPALNIVYGPNEAGKSTFRDAIRFGLYGLPKKLSSAQKVLEHEPTYFSSSSPFRQITGVLQQDGAHFFFSQASADGGIGEPAFADDSAREALLKMREDITLDEYSTIWNISTAELINIEPAKRNEAVDSHSASAIFATHTPPDLVAKSLGKRLESYTKDRQSDPANNLQKTLNRLKELHEKRRRLEEEAGKGLEALAEQSELEATQQELSDSVNNWHSAHTQASTDAAQLSSTKASCDELTSKMATLEAEIAQLEEAIDQFDDQSYQALFALKDTITEAHSQESGIEASRSELYGIAEDMQEKAMQLERYHSLPSLATEPDINALIEETNQFAQRLIGAEDTLKRSEQQLSVLKKRREDLEAETKLSELSVVDERPKHKIGFGRIIGGTALIVLSLVLITLSLLDIFGSTGTLLVGLFGIIAFVLGVSTFVFAPRMAVSDSTADDSSGVKEQQLRDLKNEEVRTGTQVALDEAAFQTALEEWKNHLHHSFPTLDPSTPPRTMSPLLQNLRDKYRLETELDVLHRKSSTLTSTISNSEKHISGLYDSLTENSFLPVMRAGIGPLYSALENALEAERVQKALRTKLDDVNAASEETGRSIERHTVIFQELFKRYPGATDYSACASIIRDKVNEAQAQRTSAQLKLQDVIAQITLQKKKIEDISTSEELQNTLDEIELVRARVESLYPLYLSDTLSKKLLENATAAYFAEHAPNFKEQASEIFRRITDGRYTNIELFDPSHSPSILVTRFDSKKFATHELSRGTADQLYIALRIGLLLTYSSNGASLPVVLDDILSTSDASRRERLMHELLLLAEQRQVIFFTFSEKIAQALQQAAANKNVDYKAYSLT